MKRSLAVIAVAIAALSPGLAASGTAMAGALPKIQSNGFGNWYRGWKVRPHMLVFGTRYFIKDLRYSHYNGHSAFATGTLLIDNCQPNCITGGHYVKATAYFYDVFDHKGPGRNFGYLRLRWDHRRHSSLLWIDSEGQWWWAALGTPPRQT